MSKLDGKIALVTGGNSGIGLATAKGLAARGAQVYITGRRQRELDAAVKSIGKHTVGIQGDVSKLSDLDRVYAQIAKDHGHLDILFANAGIAELSPLGAITEAHYDSIFDINVKGLLFTVQKALPLLRAGSSVILNASIVASKGIAASSVYSATKAAVRSFARTWTTDLKGKGIRVNVVSPGPIVTPGFTELTGGEANQKESQAQFSAAVPLGRMGHPDEIANAVAFLASDEASFITGAELFVDGGLAQV
jgi:NAD(P)-dependent dehydrogenase (short-subunit alcohol dehydrogenase family)